MVGGMRSNAARKPAPSSAASRVGDLLREWRAARRMSQLDLALEANVSSRHLSWVETGKSQPGRDLVDQLADALEMPLRERNALLIAAGYAPKYRETALADPEMALLRKAVEFIIRQQEPFPAFVIDRHWDVLMVNPAMERVFGALKPGGPTHGNILRQVFDPADMRPLLANWEEVAGDRSGICITKRPPPRPTCALGRCWPRSWPIQTCPRTGVAGNWARLRCR